MQTLEQVDARLKRWQTRAKRANTMVDKLLKARRRLEKKKQATAAPSPVVVGEETPAKEPSIKPAPVTVGATTESDKLDMPAFLKRDRDTVAAEAVRKEVEERKRAKSRGRIAKLKAQQSGATKAMPLTGKAALAYIRGTTD